MQLSTRKLILDNSHNNPKKLNYVPKGPTAIRWQNSDSDLDCVSQKSMSTSFLALNIKLSFLNSIFII